MDFTQFLMFAIERNMVSNKFGIEIFENWKLAESRRWCCDKGVIFKEIKYALSWSELLIIILYLIRILNGIIYLFSPQA